MKILKNRAILFSLICLFALIGILGTNEAKAATKTGSITFKIENHKDIPFRIYLVAKQDGHDGYKMVGDFKDYSIDLFSDFAAETLKDYVTADGIQPMLTKKTDNNGEIVFEDLEEGAYLILGDDFDDLDAAHEMCTYKLNPVFVSVPGKETVDSKEQLVWDIKVNGKYTTEKVPEEKDRTKYFVQKIWTGDNANDRPESITVQLYQDDQFKEEVVLNAANNWYYKWTDLDYTSTYKVIEKDVPAGYVVSNEKVGDNKTVITNKKPESTTSTTESTTSTTATTEKDNSKDDSSSKKSNTSSKIPQTGQLWWPIGLLLCGGLICLIIGVLAGKRKED